MSINILLFKIKSLVKLTILNKHIVKCLDNTIIYLLKEINSAYRIQKYNSKSQTSTQSLLNACPSWSELIICSKRKRKEYQTYQYGGQSRYSTNIAIELCHCSQISNQNNNHCSFNAWKFDKIFRSIQDSIQYFSMISFTGTYRYV